MPGHFGNLLKQASFEPDPFISKAPFLADWQKKQMRVWNETETDYPKDETVIDLFEAHVQQTPHAVAVVFEE